ncbi:DUF3102 domain-containing protein [Leptospira ilyithenensis]|nr:DUF3102 domain-containing protein [Leptospira ilyithenensis]
MKDKKRSSIFAARTGLDTNQTKDNLVAKDDTAEKINRLQESIETSAKNMVKTAIIIGDLLNAKKAELKHGDFLPWIESNLTISRFTASRYMKLYENRDRLNVARVQHLREALALLSENKVEKEINPDKTVNVAIVYKEWKTTKRRLTNSERQSLQNLIEKKLSLEKRKITNLQKDLSELKKN